MVSSNVFDHMCTAYRSWGCFWQPYTPPGSTWERLCSYLSQERFCLNETESSSKSQSGNGDDCHAHCNSSSFKIALSFTEVLPKQTWKLWNLLQDSEERKRDREIIREARMIRAEVHKRASWLCGSVSRDGRQPFIQHNKTAVTWAAQRWARGASSPDVIQPYTVVGSAAQHSFQTQKSVVCLAGARNSVEMWGFADFSSQPSQFILIFWTSSKMGEDIICSMTSLLSQWSGSHDKNRHIEEFSMEKKKPIEVSQNSCPASNGKQEEGTTSW